MENTIENNRLIAEFMGENNQVLDFNVWRKKAADILPELSKRVFELRSKTYPGCGFQWSLEKSLGSCIKSINNYDEAIDIGCQIAAQVCFESLIEKVLKIESQLNQPPTINQ